MKQAPNSLLRQYGAALRKHMEEGSASGPPLAHRVGRRAVATGLSALDLARMHDQAVSTLGLPAASGTLCQRADAFFAEVLAPVELTSRSTRAANSALLQTRKILNERTQELKASYRLLDEGALRRSALEEILRSQENRYGKLSEESHDLQQSLRQVSRHMLSVQEDDRATISRTLHHEIAQELLGIQIRLVSLKKEAARNTIGLKRDIASTERLVKKSAQKLERFVARLS